MEAEPLSPRLASLLLFASGSLAISAISLYAFRASEMVAALLLMLYTLLVGNVGTKLDAVVTSFVAALCLDFFFIPPVYQVTIDSPRGWIGLFVFLAASLFASNLSAALRRQRDELAFQQKESERLHALSRALLLSDRSEDMRRLLVNRCMELFGFDETVLFESANGEFWRSSSTGTIQLDHLRKVATYGVPESPEPATHIIPITLGNQTFGSLGFRGEALVPSSAQALSNTLATGMAQAQAHEAGNQAEAVRRSEELKSVMIDALAHDLKTPLTAIEIAADTLMHAPSIVPDQRLALTQEIWQAAQRLRALVHGAIHLARIDAKRLRLESRPTSVVHSLEAAVRLLRDQTASHFLAIEVEPDMPDVLADGELLIQALKQLVDNALKYTAAGSKIFLNAGQSDGLIWISVRDQGPGLTELEQGRIFEKFYRGQAKGSNVQGTGMGLAIAKEIAEAHGGSISVESQLGQGTRFTITLKAAPIEQVV